jgi:hypothetical protein
MPEITKEAIERMKGSLMRQMKGFAVYDERGVTPEFEDYATMCPDCGHVSGSGGCAECAANREAYEGDKADRASTARWGESMTVSEFECLVGGLMFGILIGMGVLKWALSLGVAV